MTFWHFPSHPMFLFVFFFFGSIPKNSEYIKPDDYHPDQYSTLRKQWYKKKMYRKYGLVYTLEDIITTE